MSALPLATLTPEESISEAHSAIYDPTAGDAKRPDWSALFHEALTQPGLLSDAYRQFHRYSAGNAMLIALQAMFRGLQLSPVASFKGWLNKGYAVKKGEKALSMVMPVTVSSRSQTDDEPDTPVLTVSVEPLSTPPGKKSGGATHTVFMLRRNWFLLSQVEPGPDVQPLEVPTTPVWSLDHAAQTLGIPLLPFEMMNGNCQGYARRDGIAINPLARFPDYSTSRLIRPDFAGASQHPARMHSRG